ncbi:uncharacterized protein F5147DRAFT_173150 [Suillus discolor]|uniref:Uncharacterized protein n=1 Tax=Suillus discolor TaxID=1912936 RepID=A0A9P7JU88_9AGAM|nr:uncharacterized protein F5147DRAFT_173150 [Suillus discolor]KAG2108502.1 hypothetical protein F5147DRAFT_173150 [Suillus discolor]
MMFADLALTGLQFTSTCSHFARFRMAHQCHQGDHVERRGDKYQDEDTYISSIEMSFFEFCRLEAWPLSCGVCGQLCQRQIIYRAGVQMRPHHLDTNLSPPTSGRIPPAKSDKYGADSAKEWSLPKSAGWFLLSTVGTMVRGTPPCDFHSGNLVTSCSGVIVLMIEAETRTCGVGQPYDNWSNTKKGNNAREPYRAFRKLRIIGEVNHSREPRMIRQGNHSSDRKDR